MYVIDLIRLCKCKVLLVAFFFLKKFSNVLVCVM